MKKPQFYVGDKVWYIIKDDDIGKAVKGTVIEDKVGAYVVKCDGRDDCGKGHYCTPYELFQSAEEAYDHEISCCESLIQGSQDCMKHDQETIEEKQKALAILKERKEELGKEVWIVCSRKGRYIPVNGRLSDLAFSGPTFETEKEAWEVIAGEYKKEYEGAVRKSGVTRYYVGVRGNVILLKDCEEVYMHGKEGFSPGYVSGKSYDGEEYLIALPSSRLFLTRAEAEAEAKRREHKE